MFTEFQEHIENVFPELLQGKSLLALSGGVDSMVLFHLMQRCALDFDLAHGNFQLRGDESDKDEHFVQQAAAKYNRNCFTKRFDTASYAKKEGLSIQMAARELRYDWFRALMAQEGITYLLTAHHADDNLETFLINLSRGSGLKGLTGIPEKSQHAFRPLLRFSREQIMAYAQQHDIPWREDLSNQEGKYLRNTIRMELVPLLKKLSPGFLGSFQRSIDHLKDSRQLVEDRCAEIEKLVASPDPEHPNIIKFDIKAIQGLSAPKAYLYPLFSPYGFSQWEDIYDLMQGQTGKMVYAQRHRLIRDRDHLLLEALEQGATGQEIFEFEQGCQAFVLPGGRKRILMERSEREGDQGGFVDARSYVYVDEDRIKYPLIVRKWQNGDYFYPKGMEGRKKLSKFFKDEKLSIPEKENIWLLCAGDQIVWVIGRRADRRFALTDQSCNILKIEVEKIL